MFVSTRNDKAEPVSSAYAIKRGLAEDGGLYMPVSIPRLSREDMENLATVPYAERCARILSLFLTDYTYEELLEDARAAYSEDKFGPSPAPLHRLSDGVSVLELWHGPTCAFKDMALQIMPRLFVRALRKCGENRTALILVATSGDTGKAALEGYRDVEGTKIKVFFPEHGVSAMQKLQMQTQEGENVSVSGIYGNFDDAQNGVKRIFSDENMKDMLDGEDVFLSSANSINWGRLVPQIVYYVSAYLDMVSAGEIRMGDPLDVCVPTGNFGNIFAAYIAKMMGLPLGCLVCASNKNKVLTDFFASGTYNRVREFYPTISPSMDILISSNLERLLYLTLGSEKCAGYMAKLNAEGEYTLLEEDLEKIRESFVGYYTDEDLTRRTIKEVYEKENYLIDTHTAVALSAAQRYMSDYKAERKMLTVSTASPYKFAKDVYASLTDSTDVPELEAPEALSALTGVAIPLPLAQLKGKELRHRDSINKEEMENATLDFAKA